MALTAGRAWGYFLGGLFLLMPVPVWCAYAITSAEVLETSRTWKTTPGAVLSSRLGQSHASSGATYWEPEVRYEYVVGGERHIGEKLRLGGPIQTTNRSYVEAVLERFPAGAEEKVFYDPADPSRSVLILESPAANIPLAMTALGLLCGGSLLWMSRRS